MTAAKIATIVEFIDNPEFGWGYRDEATGIVTTGWQSEGEAWSEDAAENNAVYKGYWIRPEVTS